MRKEPFQVGDYIHVYNRGNKKLPIVQDESDRWRFLRILRYFNDEYSPQNIFRELDLVIRAGLCERFEWPRGWPEHKPLVKILSYHLSPNHFHLCLKEIASGGVTKFMRKFGVGFTNYVNLKYGETGRIFQGAYKSRTVNDEKYLQYLDTYIQVLNPIELYPGGIEQALKVFDKAFDSAINYPFCSLGESFGKRNLFILDRDILQDTFSNPEVYKEFSYDALMVRNIREVLKRLTVD